MTGFGLVVYEGRIKRFEELGHATRPESKAQLDLGTLVPYNSPPLIHARLPGRIKELKRHFCFRESNS